MWSDVTTSSAARICAAHSRSLDQVRGAPLTATPSISTPSAAALARMALMRSSRARASEEANVPGMPTVTDPEGAVASASRTGSSAAGVTSVESRSSVLPRVWAAVSSAEGPAALAGSPVGLAVASAPSSVADSSEEEALSGELYSGAASPASLVGVTPARATPGWVAGAAASADVATRASVTPAMPARRMGREALMGTSLLRCAAACTLESQRKRTVQPSRA